MRRSGSVLLLVIWMLFGCSLIVFAVARDAIDGLAQGTAAFRRAAAGAAARSAVHVAVANLARYEPQPARMLRESPPDDFRKHAADRPVGWYVARTRHPADAKEYALSSEQARMPLSALTTSAVAVLFPDATKRQRYASQVASRRLAPGGAVAAQTDPFRDSYELLTIGAASLGDLLGQDFNENGVEEDFESARPRTSPIPRPGVDRGIIDLVTAYTDNRFDPYEADRKLTEAYLTDWGSDILVAVARARDGRPPLQLLRPDDPAWAAFCRRALVNVSTFFRVTAFGAIDGDPVARCEAVVEYVTAAPGRQAPAYYRIAHWRQEL